MKHSEIVDSLNFIRPGEKWTLTGDELENLEWLDETEKPSNLDIQNGYAALLAHQEQLKIDRHTKRAIILDRLGITEEEAKLLLG